MQLAAITNSIQIPGCELQKNGLVITGDLTPEMVNGIAGTLLAVEHCAMWWWGDFLCAVEKKYDGKYDEAMRVSSYDYGTLRNAKWVCSNFHLSFRYDISFSHHLCAITECGEDGIKDAREWLRKAIENKWSVSELRKQIRLGQAEHTERNEDAGGFNPLSWIMEGKNYYEKMCKDSPPETWSPAQRAAFVEDFGWVQDIMKKIK